MLYEVITNPVRPSAATVPGKPLDKAYTEKNTDLVRKGLDNLMAHLDAVKKSGIPPVVCINHFATDDDDRITSYNVCYTKLLRILFRALYCSVECSLKNRFFI